MIGRKTICKALKLYCHAFFFFIEITHCMKSVHSRSSSGPHFPALGLNTERYSVSLHIQSECVKIQTRITPNTDTFYAVTACRLGRFIKGGPEIKGSDHRCFIFSAQNSLIHHIN